MDKQSQLRSILSRNLNNANKEDLLDILAFVYKSLTQQEYGTVTEIEYDELSALSYEILLGLIDQFRSVFAPELRVNFEETSVNQGANENKASNADFAAELSSIDFEKLIGGPLNAAVTAQANASLTTVNFIRETGFDDNGDIRMVDFSYNKTNDEGQTEKVEIKVPFISVLSVPSLRIETLDVDFNVKLNSVFSKNVSSQFGLNVSGRGGWGPVKFSVSASYKRSSSSGVKVEKEYTMGVKVKATNDEMPAGLERVLNLLSEG